MQDNSNPELAPSEFSPRGAISRLAHSDLGCLFYIVLAIALPLALFHYADNAGYFPHFHDTPVWIQSDWLPGEFRRCQMITTTPFTGKQLSPAALAQLPRLFCSQVDDSGQVVFINSVAPEDSGAAFNAVWEVIPDDLWSGGLLRKYFHVLPVRYSGRIHRTDKWLLNWRCQRKSQSLVCKALD
jgi:hypothetical protein